MAFLQEQDVEVEEGVAGEVDAAGELVARRGDEDEVLVEERDVTGRDGAGRGEGEQQDVEPAGGEAVREGGGAFLVDVEFEVGEAVADEPQDGGQQVGGDGGDDAEVQGAGEGTAGGVDGFGEGVQGAEDAACVFGDALAQGGDDDAAGGAFDELGAEGVLQGGDRPGESGLAGAAGRGGVPEVPVLGDGDEGAELGDAGGAGLGVVRGGTDSSLRSDASSLAISPISPACGKVRPARIRRTIGNSSKFPHMSNQE